MEPASSGCTHRKLPCLPAEPCSPVPWFTHLAPQWSLSHSLDQQYVRCLFRALETLHFAVGNAHPHSVCMIHGSITPTATPLCNAHPYFPLEHVARKARITHDKNAACPDN